jgi:tRNA G37 N-methylase TrmD
MKNPALALTAALAAITSMAATSASAFEYGALAANVNTAAFEKADDRWRRVTGNRIAQCGAYGQEGKRRIDVLVDRYRTLADAVSAGDESAALSAADSLSRAINANDRFETCWTKISRKEGVSGKFSRMIKKG